MRISLRRPLIAGNWKMNGTKEQVESLLQALRYGCEHVELAELVLLVPFVFLGQVEHHLLKTQLAWGAQNLSHHAPGAWTGEISASMLLDFHCSYVIVGHSERRRPLEAGGCGESNALIAQKFHAATFAGLRPILCVGETEAEYDRGQTASVIHEQLAAVLELTDNSHAWANAVVAYEPVWAIGTGKHAAPVLVQEIHAAIRAQLAGVVGSKIADQIRIVYGGSVKPENAAAVFVMPDVDGALIGGASLHAEAFLEIGKLCNNLF